MIELVDFLRARFDEDEQAARKAASLCGCHQAAPSWLFGDDATDGRILVADDPHPKVKRKLGRRWNGSYDGLFMAEHIARHDPAHVLREVEAKRWILDEHRQVVDGGHDSAWPAPGHCAECWSPAHEDYQPFPCPTVRLLALPYADHDDYQESWKP